MTIYPWLSTQWQRMLQSQRGDSMAHAYLFSGPKGIGKEDFAQAFARHLLCHQSATNNDAGCGDCASCRLFDAETHPDILVLQPSGASQTIQVDQVRHLIEYLSLKPHQASHKVAIIQAADRMNTNAANSLLKSLEEPPPASMLILSSCYANRLLPTIKSRCQQIQFSLPDTEISRPWLASRLEKPDQAELFLRLAQGAPLSAISFSDDETMEQRSQIFSTLQGLRQKGADVSKEVKACLKVDSAICLDWMWSFISDMAKLKVAEYPPSINNPDLADPMRRLMENLSLEDLLDYQSQVQRSKRYVQGNMNRELLFEELLFAWCELGLHKRQQALSS